MSPEPVTAKPPVTEPAECLIILAPDWFRREDFLDWREGKRLE